MQNNNENQKIWDFVKLGLQSKTFHIFMIILRIATFIGIIILIAVMIKEIEIVKLLNSDVCDLCMHKTGCQCYCLN